MSEIKVRIEYLEKYASVWVSNEIALEAYFDEDNEPLSWESVPLHNHAVDYLEIGKDKLQATRVVIDDNFAKVKRTITENFWNKGKNRLIERIDEGEEITDQEIILELLLNEHPETWEILRCHRDNGILKINYHGFIAINEDGSEVERKIET